MQAVLNSALPVFALILTGFICGFFGVFDRTATDNLNRFAIYLALPSLMFTAMSKITPDQVQQFGFAGAFGVGFAFTFAVAFAVSRVRGRRVASASIEGLDASYSNVGFMVGPVVTRMVVPSGAAPFTDRIPIKPSPPVRLSTITLRSSAGPRYCAIRRQSASPLPPAAKGKTILVSGPDCPHARRGRRAPSQAG